MAGGAVAVGGPDADRSKLYNQRVTLYVYLVGIAAGSGGLLFGYDNGITGGVISMSGFQSRFFPDTAAGNAEGNAYCQYNDHILQLFTSSLFLAGAFSSLVGSWTSRHLGRKVTMLMGSICFLIGTVLVASAFQIAQLVVGRVVLGFGVGFACQATPLYLSEMAPYNLRGAMNFCFQLAVTIGIFVAQLINYGTQNLDPWGWRLSLALGAVPACIFFLGICLLPDTPNSLIERGKLEQGERVLRRVRGVKDVMVELEDIVEAVNISNSIPNPWRTILRRRYRPQLVITILIPIIQQFTGINAIIFYAPQLFASVGGANAALLNTVIIGAVNVGATIIALCIVDRFGRKALFVEGGVQALLCEIVVGILISVSIGNGYPGSGLSTPNLALDKATIAMICIYIAGFAWSWGPLGWLVPSEIQPLETRASGTALNTCVNLLMTFLIGQTFLSMLCSMKFGVFFFFAGCLFLGVLFAIFFIPETRNVPIEEMEEVRIGQHWFWRRITRGSAPPVTRMPRSGLVEISGVGPDGAPKMSFTRERNLQEGVGSFVSAHGSGLSAGKGYPPRQVGGPGLPPSGPGGL